MTVGEAPSRAAAGSGANKSSSSTSLKKRSQSPGRVIALENSNNFHGINDKIKGVLSQNHRLEQENQRLFELLSKLKNDQKCEVERALNSYLSEINHLRSSLSTQTTENGRFKLQLESANQKNDELFNQMKKINATLQSKNSENQRLMGEVSRLKTSIDVEKVKSEEYFKKSEDLSKHNKDLQYNLDSALQNLNKQKLKFVEMESKLQTEVEAAKFSTSVVNTRIDAQVQPEVGLTESTQNLSTELFNEQEKIVESYEQKLSNLKTALTSAHQEEVDNLESYLANQEQVITTLKDENKTVRTQLEAERTNAKLLEEVRNKNESLREKNICLARQLAEKKSENNEILELNSNLKYNIESLQKHLDIEDSRSVANESLLPKKFKFTDEKSNVFTESKSNGPIKITNVCPRGEFIEISNIFGEDVSLNNLKLVQKLSDGNRFEMSFNENDVIPAHGSIVFTNDQVKLQNQDLSLLSIGNDKQLDTILCDQNDPNVSEYIIRNLSSSSRTGISGLFNRLLGK